MSTKRLFSACLLAIVGSVGLSCSEGNPVAPNGTILTISTSSNRIAANGNAVITVTGRRPDGNPIAEGTDVFFSATLGTISPTMAEADANGQVTAILVGDGRIGSSTVTASLDGTRGGGTTGGGTGGDGGTGGTTTTPTTTSGTTTVSISIQVGSSTTTLTVVANPDNIPINGTATITILARDTSGSPIDAGQRVSLVSNLGTLNPSNPLLDNNGRAESTLRAGTQNGDAKVQAFMGPVAGEVTVRIRDAAATIALNPTPLSVNRSDPADVKLEVGLLNAQGQAVAGIGVQFEAAVGTLSATQGITNSSGLVSVTLALAPADVDEVQGSFEVKATTPGLASVTRQITVTGG